MPEEAYMDDPEQSRNEEFKKEIERRITDVVNEIADEKGLTPDELMKMVYDYFTKGAPEKT